MALSHVASASGITELVRPCSINGTIVGSVASTAYFAALLQLAGSASSHAGFPCVATMMMDSGLPPHHQIVPLPGLASNAHPRQAWCQGKMAKRHGWRRSHFYRVAMWHMIVGSGFDLLAVDCDWYFTANPLPALHHNLGRHATDQRTAIGGPRIDVTGWYDGYTEKLINVGLLWVRSTHATVQLMQDVQNRTAGSWEQAMFNEELSFRSNAPCCHCSSCLSVYFARNWTIHTGGKASRKVYETAPDVCASGDDWPPAASPPPKSTYRWPSVWNPREYNNLPISSRTLGRCTGPAHKCYKWEAYERKVGHLQSITSEMRRNISMLKRIRRFGA